MTEHQDAETVVSWKALSPSDGEPRYEVGRSAKRSEVVRGLWQLARLLDERPEIPVPVYGYCPMNVFATGTEAEKRAQVDHAAGLLQAAVVDDTLDGGHYSTSLSFGIVHYKFVAIPSETTPPAFTTGQDIQLTPAAAREQARHGRALAGVVVAGPDEQGEAHYNVRFPGWNTTIRLPATALEPAIPLGPVSTSRGTVSSIDTAENALVETAARLRASLRSGGAGSEDDERDLIRLAYELGRVCGLSEHELIRQLESRITARTAECLAVAAAPAALAARDAGNGEEHGLAVGERPGRRILAEPHSAQVPARTRR